jgi:hypothetical protein
MWFFFYIDNQMACEILIQWPIYQEEVEKEFIQKFCNMKNWLCNKMISQCLDLIMSLPLMNAFLLSTLCENLMGLQGMGVAWWQSTFISFNLSIMLMHTIMENQLFLFLLCFCVVFNNS